MKTLFLAAWFLLWVHLLAGQQTEYLIQELNGHKGAVLSVAISPDGQYLVSGGEDKVLIIWSLPRFEEVYKYPDNYFAPRAITMTATNTLFVGSGSGIRLIDLENNTLEVFEGNSTHIWSIDYAPERNKLAAGSYDYTLKVWDAGTAELEFELEGHEKSTLPVAFSPDEKYLVSGSLDRSVKIWNAGDGSLIRSLERHTDNIYDVAFHPSGKYFATASRDKTIRLWDFATGEVLVTYTGHDQGVVDIEFLPDGEHLISASFDGSIRLWQTRTGRMVYTFATHEGAVNSIDVSSNGRYMVSGGADGKVLYWEIDSKIYVEYAFYDEFWEEKENNSLFDERRKGEKRDDYQKRMDRAAEKEDEIIARYYDIYLKKIRELEYKK